MNKLLAFFLSLITFSSLSAEYASSNGIEIWYETFGKFYDEIIKEMIEL